MFNFHTSPTSEIKSISRRRAIYWIIRDVTSCYVLHMKGTCEIHFYLEVALLCCCWWEPYE